MFAERLKILREDKKLTQKQLAELLDVSSGTVGMWEQGRRTPPVAMMEKIASLLGVEISAFVDTKPELTDEEIEQLGKWTVEDDFKEMFEKIYRLDEYGQEAVEQLVKAEFFRCAKQKTLRDLNISVRVEL